MAICNINYQRIDWGKSTTRLFLGIATAKCLAFHAVVVFETVESVPAISGTGARDEKLSRHWCDAK